jgi:hypothetical protein
MMKALLSLALLASVSLAQQNHDFKQCATPIDKLGVTAVDVAPDSPIPGQNLTVTFTATPTQDVVAGDVYTITVKVFGVALGHVDFDFCKDLGVTCPVKAGTANVKFSAVYLVPKAAPSGVPLTAEFTAKNAGTVYSCIDVDVTMGKPPSASPVLLRGFPVARRSADAATCLHHEDKPSNKCYEACGEGAFVVKGLDTAGACPDQYTETDSTKTVKACSDGVTNLKYCTAGGLHVVSLTEKTKGTKGACQHAVQANKCFEGCAEEKFQMKGLTDDGACPSLFSVVEKTENVISCSDGVTNVKYCTKPLYVVNVTMKTKGEAGLNNMAWPWTVRCLHREDATNHKCYEACARDSSFKVKGLNSYGACPSKYSETDSTKTVKACSDGVTNLKYCTAGGLHEVSLTEKTKGESGMPNKAYWLKVAAAPALAPYCLHQEDLEDHKCFEACAPKSFATKGISTAGSCPSQYSTVDKTQTVYQCPDGVTNVRYCADTALNVTITTKGEGGFDGVIPFGEYGNMRANAQCTKDSDCPSSYCQNGFCHGCFDKCCETDSDCTKKGMTYCQNDATKMPPYFCHA